MTELAPADLWLLFRQHQPDAPESCPPAFHFCDNQADADECARLVVAGIKQATAASLAEMELAGEALPKPGDHFIITDFSGNALAVIRTTSVEIRRFADVPAEFAYTEGEGDRSLAWWQDAHRRYFERVLHGTGIVVDDDLLVVCECFAAVFVAPRD